MALMKCLKLKEVSAKMWTQKLIKERGPVTEEIFDLVVQMNDMHTRAETGEVSSEEMCNWKGSKSNTVVGIETVHSSFFERK